METVQNKTKTATLYERLGGEYTGRDMASAHSNHKITEADYNSSNDDLLEALGENGVGEEEKREVIALLDTMKQQVIRG